MSVGCGSFCSSAVAAAPAAARLPIAPAADEGRSQLLLQLSCCCRPAAAQPGHSSCCGLS
eukprot:13917368-Alexandrium_andersonii.AAC.1